jgi:hypothetical protein
MDILILKSNTPLWNRDPYSITMNTAYAERFIGHLRKGHCSACGSSCVQCRARLVEDFSDFIVQVIEFPALLPVMLEDAEEYLPQSVKSHDVVVAISVHEEILISFLERFDTAKGVIIPIEEPWWISPYAQNKIRTIGEQRGIEVAFPKPFCSLDAEEGVTGAFRKQFKVGKPEVAYRVADGIIRDARVRCSAPCGATYFVARNMVGRSVNRELVNHIDALLSAYPCTASTEVDREFGDSIIHRAVHVQRGILRNLCLDVITGAGSSG